jgi:steroid delta-isomerase-like uncharacterized protein
MPHNQILREDQKATALRCFTELWAAGKLETADEIISADYAGHAPGDRGMRGREQLKELVRAYHTGFPGLEISVLGQLAERDRVVTEFTMAGVHTGRWMGVPATGREIWLGCLAFTVVRDGLIAEQWYEWERRKLLEQLKLVPILAG